MIRPPRSTAILALGAALVAAATAGAAIQGGGDANVPLVLIGADDDSTADPVIQPPGTVNDQSTRKADILGGGQRDDLLIGREGPDVIVAGPGSDVIVGGPEAGSDPVRFPNADAALGGPGDDVFIWAPGDGPDSFTGGEPPAFTVEQRRVPVVIVRGGESVRVFRTRSVRVPSPPDDDVLVLGTMPLSAGDNHLPQLRGVPGFGQLPSVNVSGAGLPPTIGSNPPLTTVRGFCELVPGSAVSQWNFLVRFFNEATGELQATIRVRAVERVICRTRGADAMTEFRLGRVGAGPPAVNAAFTPAPGSKLARIVS